MNERRKQIGFSQRIRLEWFEQTTNLILAGNDKVAINDALQDTLLDKVSVGGESSRNSREKIITILLKTWLTVPHGLEQLRDEGLEMLQGPPCAARIAIHWGMILAAYPFWGAVAAHTGRLLKLQGTAAATHVQRRVKEDYGERETASRATRRILRSYIDWGVLDETGRKGVYCQGKQYLIEDPKFIAWIIEASLHARANRAAAMKDLLDSPNIFPFRLSHVPAEHILSLSSRLSMLRHGLDDSLVMLRGDQQSRDKD